MKIHTLQAATVSGPEFAEYLVEVAAHVAMVDRIEVSRGADADDPRTLVITYHLVGVPRDFADHVLAESKPDSAN